MPIVINFNAPTAVTVTPPVTKTLSSLTVEYYVENPSNHKLSAKFFEINRIIDVFVGADYDAVAANWTDADVANKVKTMF